MVPATLGTIFLCYLKYPVPTLPLNASSADRGAHSFPALARGHLLPIVPSPPPLSFLTCYMMKLQAQAQHQRQEEHGLYGSEIDNWESQSLVSFLSLCWLNYSQENSNGPDTNLVGDTGDSQGKSRSGRCLFCRHKEEEGTLSEFKWDSLLPSFTAFSGGEDGPHHSQWWSCVSFRASRHFLKFSQYRNLEHQPYLPNK